MYLEIEDELNKAVQNWGGEAKKVFYYREVKKLDMENRKESFMGAHVLGILGQDIMKRFQKMMMFSLPSDPRFTDILNGRTKGQIHPAKKKKKVLFGPHGSFPNIS